MQKAIVVKNGFVFPSREYAEKFISLQKEKKTPATRNKEWYHWYTEVELKELIDFIYGIE